MKRTRRTSIWIAAMTVLTAACAAHAAAARETPPPPQKAKEIKFPAFSEKTLANGLRVVVIEQHEEPLVNLRLVVRAGKLYEPTDKPGLAAATASLLTEGTASRKANDLAATIDGVGGSLNAFTDSEDAYASAEVTSDQIDLGFDLLSDVVLHPSFAPDEVERWRTRTLSGLKVSEQTAEYLVAAVFDRVLYGSHPYGQPALGTQESVKQLTRDELVAFHRGHYLPNGAILAVVGDVHPAAAFAKAERAFGGWPKGEAPQAPVFHPVPLEHRRIVVIDKPDAVQTQVRVGQVGLAFTDPDYFTAQVYNAVVGGTQTSRLYQEVRRKRGLSYGAGSFLSKLSQPGAFRASTYTKTESTIEALDTVLAVLDDSRKEIPAAELTASKTFITGAFPLEIETPDGIASKVVEAMIFGYGRPFLESYRSRIDAVDAKEVQAFAEKRIHPDRMIVVLVGNAKAFGAELAKKYGEVETIPVSELDLERADLRKPKAAAAATVPVSATDRARAEALLRHTREALGGAAFTGQRSQISRGSATLSAPGLAQPMKIESFVSYQLLPDKRRTELALPMGTLLQGFDGQVGWRQMNGQTTDASEEMREQSLRSFDVLRSFDRSGYAATPLPDETVDGRTLKVVALSDGKGHDIRFAIDPTTYLVEKIEHEEKGKDASTRLSDYRKVGGVEVAHHLATSLDGKPYLTIELESVEIDAQVDPALFAKPAG